MAKRETLNISLTRQLQKFIDDRVKSGRYTSASEVVREGLRLMQEREAALESFRRQIAEGTATADRGDFVRPELLIEDLRRLSRRHRRKAG